MKAKNIKSMPVLRAVQKSNAKLIEADTKPEPYIEYRGGMLHVNELDEKSVDPHMLNEMHMDNGSRGQIPPKLTDQALLETAEKYLHQCSPDGVAVTYDQMLIQHIVPELIERLKEASGE